MHKDKLESVAASDGESLKKSASIGYAINLVMDYGSGRQVTISGTLPLGATLSEMNLELDKLRLATNRQSSLVVLRDVENTVAMAKRTVLALELMVKEYEEGVEKEMQRLAGSDTSKHTLTKQQAENLRSQAANYRMTKREEIMRNQSDIDKGEMLMARIKKELSEG